MSKEPVWMVVAQAAGVMEGEIIAGRLKSLGIPTYVHRESLGAVLGLSIGLGQTSVVVPEEFYEAAMQILYPDETIPWVGDGEADEAYLEGNDGDDDDSELR